METQWLSCALTFMALVHFGFSQREDNVVVAGLPCPQYKLLPTLPVLPGRGWDNLLNKEMGQLTEVEYHTCKLSEDRALLIPDGMFVLPARQSSLTLQAELFDHWANYTDVTAETINHEAKVEWVFSASGLYSDDNKRAKQYQLNDKAVISRVFYRSTLYTVGYEPSVRLNPKVKHFLLTVARHIALEEKLKLLEGVDEASENATSVTPLNECNKSDYLLELLVRDYGTHVLKRIELGAVLYQEDFLSNSLNLANDTVRRQVRTNAKVSFSDKLHWNLTSRSNNSVESLNSYHAAVTSTFVNAKGGAQFKPTMSIADWIETIPFNLVAVDRVGDPLHFLVTPQALPEISPSEVHRLATKVASAIARYYQRNTRPGCIELGSPNYDFQANVGDGSCVRPNSTYDFGGVFERCTPVRSQYGNICGESAVKDKLQVNPKTGTTTCPKGYQEVLVLSKELRRTGSNCRTRHCGFLFLDNCRNCESLQSIAKIESFWCAAKRDDDRHKVGLAGKQRTSYMFGGLYSAKGSKLVNPVTNAQSCPPTYIPLALSNAGLQICVSDDHELGSEFEIPFGGFFTCKYGNPFYTDLEPQTAAAEASNMSGTTPPAKSDAELHDYVQACPDGFTQHVAEIVDNCQVHYCVAAGSFKLKRLLPIIRPPFHDVPCKDAEAELTMARLQSQGEKTDTNKAAKANLTFSMQMVVCIFMLTPFL